MRAIENEQDFTLVLPLLFELQTQHFEALPSLFRSPKSFGQFVEDLNKFNTEEDNMRMKQGLNIFFIFEKAQRIIGCAYLQKKERVEDIAFLPSKYLELMCFIIDSSHRHQGLGKKSLLLLKDWAKENAFDSLELSVLCDNPSAISSYKSIGFQKTMITMNCKL